MPIPADRITEVRLGLLTLPLQRPISDAKVLTGRQRPLTDVAITPFLQLATLAAHHHLTLAPHFAMEIHAHLAAAYPHEPWVEHFDWLRPLFNERLDIRDGRIHLSPRPGLGVSLSEQARAFTVDTATIQGAAP